MLRPVPLSLVLLFAVALGLLHSIEGRAQHRADQSHRWEWVIGGYLGGAHTQSSALTVSQPGLGTRIRFDDVRFAGRSFSSPNYYGFRGGVFFPDAHYLGIEAEFTHLKVYSDPRQRVRATGTLLGQPIDRELPLGEIVQQYSISHGVNLLLFNVVGRYRIHRDQAARAPRLILSGRFGLGPTIPHTESTIGGRHQEQYELRGLALQLAGGAEVHLWRGIYGLGEYKSTRTSQDGKVFSGKAEVLLRSHHGVFGLSYHF